MAYHDYYYILGPGHIAVPCSAREWSRWIGSLERRRVALDEIAPGVSVSTVFIGLNHRWFDDGPPLLFETVVFDDYEEGDEMRRYATWEEAAQGHAAMVAELRQRIAART